MAKKKKPRKPNAEYELPKEFRRYKHRIMSFDPGTRNMGVACVGVDKHDRLRPIANSVLTYPIESLVDNYLTNRARFCAEVKLWLDKFDPDLIIAERFQTRGNGGPLIELVSTMNAVIGMMRPKTPFKFVTAATWKNKFNRRFETQLDEVYANCLTTPHAMDATLIGCYGLELALGRNLKYGPAMIMRRAEEVSCLPLRRPRKPRK